MATTIMLSNGVKMPSFGLGTWQANEDEVAAAIRVVLENGYRLIDTAAAYVSVFRFYQNKTEIGAVLQEFFKAAKLKREDIFITTKLFWNSNREEDVEPSIRQSLKQLQLDYVDLYLVHMLAGLTLEDVWHGMEKIYDKKLARAIEVSCSDSVSSSHPTRNLCDPEVDERKALERECRRMFNFSLSDDDMHQLNKVKQEPRVFMAEFMEGANEDPFKDERKKV
ncbi:alcohol dehydrogenase [Aphelenchoides besseyi]|nr:alcohol dehydrogenase [Aphelenchoides besseyi]